MTDRATAEALKPWYGYFCKRPCFHDEYLQTFNRDNVTLVDTRGRGVERITESGVVVDGVSFELDCLIFATGFEVGTDYCRRTGFELIGRDGMTLTERWRDGVRTFQGLCANGFPNCFIESIAQAGLTVNFPYLLDVQATHVAWIIAWALATRHHRGRGVGRRRSRLGRHGGGAIGRRPPSGPRRARPATTTARARRTPRPGKAASSSADPPNTPTSWRLARKRGIGGIRRSRWRYRPMKTRGRYLIGRLRAATRRSRPPKVAIIGAGFGGLGTAVALRRAGIDDLVIIDGDDGVGGTWRRNTYPGAACDIQSHLYSFSFAPNKSWSRTYARQPEILAYLESVADDFDLRRHLMLDTSGAHRPLERRVPGSGT